MTRAISDIREGIASLDKKMDDRPDWADITRLEKRRDTEQAKQDAAIAVVEARVVQLMFAVIGASLAAVGSIVSSLTG